MSDFYHSVKQLVDFAESDVKRVGTGIRVLDERIRGVAPGEVCMILGSSGSGKSVIGQNIIHANKTLPSIFFSMEMPANLAVTRLYSIWSDTSNTDAQLAIESGNPPTGLWDMVTEFLTHRVIDQSGLSINNMTDHVQQYERDLGYRPEFVVVDYLELLGGVQVNAEGVAGVDAQATMLKNWARDEDMRVFVLHQRNQQQQEWQAPTMRSARYGGTTQSDFVIGLWRSHKDPEKDFAERLRLKNTICANIIKDRIFGTELDYTELPILPSLRIWQEEIHERRHENAHGRSTEQEGSLPDPFRSASSGEYHY